MDYIHRWIYNECSNWGYALKRETSKKITFSIDPYTRVIRLKWLFTPILIPLPIDIEKHYLHIVMWLQLWLWCTGIMWNAKGTEPEVRAWVVCLCAISQEEDHHYISHIVSTFYITWTSFCYYIIGVSLSWYLSIRLIIYYRWNN